MRYAPCKPAYRVHLLRLYQLFLRAQKLFGPFLYDFFEAFPVLFKLMLHALALRDVADVALDRIGFALKIYVADELNVYCFVCDRVRVDDSTP